MQQIITKHADLAKAISGKRILHMNSLGKDAVLTLEWLNNYAKVEVVSVFFALKCGYHSDPVYWEYLKRRFPRTKFVKVPSLIEMNEVMDPMFQSPLFTNYVINNQEYDSFDQTKAAEQLREKYGCAYIASGMSCYEGMGRALYLRRVGLLDEKRKSIYPIGLMKQKQIFELLKSTGIKLNPSYKFHSESHDTPSYFKMRSAFVVRPQFKRIVYKHFPLLALDEYRYEVLFNGKKARR